MSWPATTRYGLETAPDSLALVQDFVNTIAAGVPPGADLLADVPTAQDWLGGALAEWCRIRGISTDVVVLDERDLGKLRSLRAELVQLIRAGSDDPAPSEHRQLAVSVTSTMTLDDTGQVDVLPRGKGWRYVACVLLLEMRDAQLGDSWRRLKTCRNRHCSVAFFDRSRNSSRVWHDVATCGNLANLRSHRERKRAEVDRTS
ncbi:CGNR zinc finger domain-containing protein [Nocardioides sp. NPDC023903]|uniref:CGNR zinc finger domain-containing protein n=1 Tax=Nocardioides sp. NPDC023903 TaxID=3157195 RepID=UPI0033CFE1E9